MGRKDELGRFGEDVATRHLMDVGMQILDRNWRCSQGELDIVALDGQTLVFCEVKTRSGLAFGGPLEAVTPSKAARLRRLASAWIAEQGPFAGTLRIDAVGILAGRHGALAIEHVRGVGS